MALSLINSPLSGNRDLTSPGFSYRNLSANILKERSGLIPTVVGVINNILVPIRRMKMTKIEYLLLQALIFYDPGDRDEE